MTNTKLRFCANLSMLFTEVPLRERFALAKTAGFHAVEIQFPYELSVDELTHLKHQHNVDIVLINVGADDLLHGGEGLASVPHKKAKFDEALTECLYYAQQLQVECVNVLAGRCLDATQKTLYLNTFKQNLVEAADFLQPLGVHCCFEAINTHDMPGFLISSTAEMQAIIDELNHPNIFMQYDIYHMAQMGSDILADIEYHHDSIGHIQFADCPGRHEPGTGKLDFATIFKSIEDSGYRGWIGAEYHPSSSADSLRWFKAYCDTKT